MNLIKKVTLAGLAAITIVAAASCGDSFDKDAGYRDITESLTLTKEYEGKNFLDDGIGLAEVSKLTDGDTSTFKLSTSSKSGKSYVIVRYHGINTPESTGRVEKWGKSASKYNASRLETAYQVVLEATTTPASTDSNGTRYLGYVWYRESETDTFKNLNLELVENGYTNVSTVIAEYQSVFARAKAFASEHKMHIWSNDTDPYFSEDAIVTTLPEIVNDLKEADPQFYSYDSEVGANVSFEGFIMDHSTSSSQHYYTVGALDDDGNIYTMSIYGAYSSYAINSYLMVGSYYRFVGTVQYYSGNFQISGLQYVVGQTGDQYTTLLEADYYAVFNSSNSRFKYSEETGIRGDLTVINAVVEGTRLTITAKAKAYQGATEETTYTLVSTVDSSYDVSKILNKQIITGGFINKDGSILIDASSIVIK